MIGKGWLPLMWLKQDRSFFYYFTPVLVRYFTRTRTPLVGGPWSSSLGHAKPTLKAIYRKLIKTIPDRSFTKTCTMQLPFYWNRKVLDLPSFAGLKRCQKYSQT